MVNSNVDATKEAANRAVRKMESKFPSPLVALMPGNFSMRDYRDTYRALMTIEEIANLAGNDASPRSADYLFGLQEFLSGERCKLISALRVHPMEDDEAEQERLCLLLEFETWCQEFTKETLQLLAASKLAREAA